MAWEKGWAKDRGCEFIQLERPNEKKKGMKSEDSLRDFRGHQLMGSCTHNRSAGGRDTERGIRAIYINIGYITQPLLRNRHSHSGIPKALKKRTPERPDTKTYYNQLQAKE